MNSRSVNLNIGGHPFVCVPLSDADFSNSAAIYVIICVSPNGSWTVLDVGQSGSVASRIDSHERKSCWSRNCQNIWVCIYRMPSQEYTKDDRIRIEGALRQKLQPKCGQR